jgi:hypothetical protein
MSLDYDVFLYDPPEQVLGFVAWGATGLKLWRSSHPSLRRDGAPVGERAAT